MDIDRVKRNLPRYQEILKQAEENMVESNHMLMKALYEGFAKTMYAVIADIETMLAPKYYSVSWNKWQTQGWVRDLKGPFYDIESAKNRAVALDFSEIWVLHPTGEHEVVVKGQYNVDTDSIAWES